ncbi:molybdenum cofactor biosynthesis protein MoaE [Rhodoflexus sp.]
MAYATAQQWTISKFAMVHPTNPLAIGEVAVVVAVATPHRKEAFEACRSIIDTLKATVPIWKKEHFEGGAVWIAAHP